jgi:hypothetical protein
LRGILGPVDVWDYFARREGEIAEMSLDGSGVAYFAEEGSDDMLGRLMGPVHFNDDASLAIHERVEIIDGQIHRTDYAYFFIVGGVEYWAYERDPSHDPAAHRHTYGHKERIDAEPVSFKHVCELAWREISVLNSQSTDNGD